MSLVLLVLIGLYSHGRMAGKDTAGIYIKQWAQERNLTFERLAFADQPKLLVADILGIKGKDREDTIRMVDEFKLHGKVVYALDPAVHNHHEIDGRDFIINLCGELGVENPGGIRGLLGEGFWTNAVLPMDWQPRADITVVTDVRADEEATRIAYLGGQIWEIKNPRAQAPGGRSEAGINHGWIAQTIFNDRTLEDYKRVVRDTVTQQLKWETYNIH